MMRCCWVGEGRASGMERGINALGPGSEKTLHVAGLGGISELWLHIRIAWGNFSSTIAMLGSTPCQMNWDAL